MDKLAEEKLQEYNFHRGLILDMLVSLDKADLSLAPIESAGTFGKQFRHLLDIEKCYVESITRGELNFFRTDIDHSLESKKGELVTAMNNVDASLMRTFTTLPDEKVHEKYIDAKEMGPEMGNVSPYQILTFLTEHEIFHEGELALYVRTMKRKFPPSWICWGLK